MPLWPKWLEFVKWLNGLNCVEFDLTGLQMSPEQMLSGKILPGQMSPWQLKSILGVHRNLSLKFHQNRIC